ncbi:MAG: nucleotidyltransferase family protein [Phycisphaerales bacterium]|nr:MAG: nucleotidyltransferase family protein [Phycisphaerales bacterium]
MMHLLERIAGKFNEAGIPLMLLKGAALNLTVYRHPHEREMRDLDLLIRPEDLNRTSELLEAEGALRRDVAICEDFIPRFHFEKEYSFGSVLPVAVDLHTRPFGVLRYSRFMPEDAFWERSTKVRFGRSAVFLPSAENMLIHLAAHCTFHRCCHAKWLEDISRWSRIRGDLIDWDRFLIKIRAWRLSHAISISLAAAERAYGPICPPAVCQELSRMPVSWRDRLAIRHSRGGSGDLFTRALVNLLTTPGLAYVLAYLLTLVNPNREYIDDWCVRHRFPWPRVARIARCLWPLLRHLNPWWEHQAKIENRESSIHGIGVFALRELGQGELIARYRGGETTKSGTYDCWHTGRDGESIRHAITGPLRYLNHSCQPNARLSEFRLIALRPIRSGHEITIDYGTDACLCRRKQDGINSRAGSSSSPGGQLCSQVTVM